MTVGEVSQRHDGLERQRTAVVAGLLVEQGLVNQRPSAQDRRVQVRDA